MPAKPLRTALGSLLIQKQYGYSDRELVEQITDNPDLGSGGEASDGSNEGSENRGTIILDATCAP